MRRRRLVTAACYALTALGACAGADRDDFERVSLSPEPNPFGPDHPLWAPQPRRDHPYAITMSADGSRLYVTLQGSEDEPGNQVAVVDVAAGRAVRRVTVGSSPTGLALHPEGRFLVVANRFSNFASVIDVTRDRVVAEVQVPFYTVEVAFTPDGQRAYLTNRWKNSVLRWDLDVGAGFTVTGDNYSGRPLDRPMGIPVGQNPRTLAVSPDGERLYVAALTGLTLSVIDVRTELELRRVALNSPPGGVIASDERVFVSHTGAGTHHPPDEGFDTNGDGQPGDGTANVMFQDLQNELAVFDRDGAPLHNYTSDTICCFDYRDVDPDHPDKGLALPPPDTWPPERVAYLPPRDTWLVDCALPERLALGADRLLVVCSGSNEVQELTVTPDGALARRRAAGALYGTGMNPHGIVLSPDGARAYVAERLGEHVTVLDLEAGPGFEQRILVGDVSGGEFPATDAEIGEAINFVTAPFTVDGDQTCVHCHREGGNLAKPVAMPLQDDPVWGTRMQMAYRGAADTRPWFFESAMDESNFFPVINEFARRENFCCEQVDPLVWSGYPTLRACLDEPSQVGCNHVLDCPDDPPPECASRSYGSEHLTRSAHFLAAADTLLGRRRTHGDALYQESVDADGQVVRRGILLDFDGVTRALGLFLMQRPRLFPNPNAHLDLPAARRGRLLFESPATGCATCHPLPLTTLTAEFNPFGLPLRFPPLVTPQLDPTTGQDAGRVNPLFLGTFPEAVQDAAGLHLGVPQLRGIWDRAERFLHDGRARSLREALATPGHPALLPGEVGRNETFGMPDTHGGTSHLSAAQLEDLILFLLTL
jgi:DNA-binding beta-propeller fold protein YncE